VAEIRGRARELTTVLAAESQSAVDVAADVRQIATQVGELRVQGGQQADELTELLTVVVGSHDRKPGSMSESGASKRA
jgi:hypothetical protein